MYLGSLPRLQISSSNWIAMRIRILTSNKGVSNIWQAFSMCDKLAKTLNKHVI
jgi:hypothetical protein